MYISPEFSEFTLQFYQYIMDDVSSEEDLINTVLSPLKNKTERANLKNFLDAITHESLSNEELRKLWWSSSADFVFHDGGELRAFLKRVRDRL